MIPAGFRLASGWLATGLGTCWGWGHPNPDARVIGPFISDDGECLCADHAIKRGALVAVAPVVEAPLDPHRYDGGVYDEPIPFTRKAWEALGAFSERLNIDPRRFVYEAAMAVLDGAAGNVAELTCLRAALATAEQRAANLEERWGEAASRAELAEQRAATAGEKLRRIGEEVEASDERDCLCDHQRGDGHRPLPCFACRVADILRDGL